MDVAETRSLKLLCALGAHFTHPALTMRFITIVVQFSKVLVHCLLSGGTKCYFLTPLGIKSAVYKS